MSMKDYILKIKGYANSLTTAGHQLDDQDVLLNVLHGLGNEYDSMVVHITSREDTITLIHPRLGLYFVIQAQGRINYDHGPKPC
ncbi:hypothetical protein ACOSP7_016544 [Xanthoceras sorbifolium]